MNVDLVQLLANVSSVHFSDAYAEVLHVFSFKDIVDIFISSFFIYLVLIFIKQTRSYFIFTTLAALVVVSYIANLFDLGLTRQLFQPILAFFLVIFVVVFQGEIRRFFRWFTFSKHGIGNAVSSINSDISDTIVKAVQDMAKLKMGSIIILAGEHPLDDIIEGGFELDGKISSPLILSIFDHTTPGHDGAMIIENRKIKRFGVHLPLAENFKGFATMGTRHRAAIGASERTDSMAIVVSEERGTISVAESGVLKTLSSAGELDDIINRFMKENNTRDPEQSGGVWSYFFLHNLYSKISAVVLALVLWFVLVLQVSTITSDFSASVEFRNTPSGLIVSQVLPSQVKVTLSGTNRDIDNTLSNNVKVGVDLKGLTPGSHIIKIDQNNLSYPTYLTYIKLDPATIEVDLSPEQQVGTSTVDVETIAPAK